MSDWIGEDQIKELMMAFSQYDTDKDGIIKVDQLGQVLHYLGQNPTDAEIQDLAYAMDTNESGDIDLPEFIQLMAKRMADSNIEDDILEAFKIFDKDGNGLISSNELKHVMGNLGEALTENEVEWMIQEADVDGDGCINYAEFFTMVTSSMAGSGATNSKKKK